MNVPSGLVSAEMCQRLDQIVCVHQNFSGLSIATTRYAQTSMETTKLTRCILGSYDR
jgi:hypothetical protein